MLLLTSTSDAIKVVTGQAVTVDVHASWVDIDGSGNVTFGRQDSLITTATTTTVVPAPGSGVTRNVKILVARNRHASSSCDTTFQHYDGTNTVTLIHSTLAPDQVLQYADEAGFEAPSVFATPFAVAYGGTGIASYASGDMLYASGATALSKLAIGTASQFMQVNAGATAPQWHTLVTADVTDLATAATGITKVGTITTGVWSGTPVTYAYGGTGLASATASDVLVATATNTWGGSSGFVGPYALGAAVNANRQFQLGGTFSGAGGATISGLTVANTMSMSANWSGFGAAFESSATSANSGTSIYMCGVVVEPGTFTVTSGSTVTDVVSLLLLPPDTLTVSGTLTNASTLYITGAPTAGTNKWALRIGAGNVAISTVTSGTWNGSLITGTYGGTGVNNGAATITLGGSLTTSGAYALTLTLSNTTSVTLPTTGTLATLVGSETLTNKTLTSPVIANVAPSADFTLTQNSVVPFTSVGASATANTLYLKAGNVAIGTSTTITYLSPGFLVNGTTPGVVLNASGAAADTKLWDVYSDGANLYGRVVSDSHGTANNWLQVARSTTTVTTITFSATTVAVSSAATFAGVGTTANTANAYLDNTNSNNLLRSTSSLAYKMVIGALTDADALRVVLGLKPIRYYSLSAADSPTREFVGFGAEDVFALDPRFVTLIAADKPDWVQYAALTAPLVSVAQTHERRIATLESSVAALQKQA